MLSRADGFSALGTRRRSSSTRKEHRGTLLAEWATIVRQKKIPSKKEPDEMSATPGRKARKAEETAEDLEYQERSE